MINPFDGLMFRGHEPDSDVLTALITYPHERNEPRYSSTGPSLYSFVHRVRCGVGSFAGYCSVNETTYSE